MSRRHFCVKYNKTIVFLCFYIFHGVNNFHIKTNENQHFYCLTLLELPSGALGPLLGLLLGNLGRSLAAFWAFPRALATRLGAFSALLGALVNLFIVSYCCGLHP